MEIEVYFSDNPNWVLNEADAFLHSEPVRHNLILTLLHTRSTDCDPGRYWVAQNNKDIVGVVLQSPLDSRVIITPMKSEVVDVVVDTISDANIALPGVAGEAATTARFAGQWAEQHRSSVFPFLGLRLYEVDKVQESSDVKGHFRKAVSDDRECLINWVSNFSVDIGEQEYTTDIDELQTRQIASSRIVDKHLSDGQLWLWEDAKPVSMVVRTNAVAGVVRVERVYTPPEYRGRGYASACVSKISKQIRDEGYRCILYTDLNNPTSNAIYRRIGYRAVAEAIQYLFK